MPSTKPEDLESRVPLLMAILIGMGTAATIAVTGRFIARTRINRNLGSDDWTMLVALIFSILANITGSIAAHHGMGRHIVSLTESQIGNGIKFVWYARMFSQTAFGFVKLSIALLYWRIFAISRTFSCFMYGTIGFNFVVTTIWLVMTIRCVPVSANWNLGRLATAKCIKEHVTIEFGFFAGVVHSVLDVTYVVLPLVFVWNLRLPTGDKIGLTFLLSLGLFAAVCSVIKLSKTTQLGKTQDITWNLTDLSIWNVVELNVGIIVGSIPPMRPLLSRIYQRTSDTLGFPSIRRTRTTVSPRRCSYIMQNDSTPFDLGNLKNFGSGVSRTTEVGTESKETILKSPDGAVIKTREM